MNKVPGFIMGGKACEVEFLSGENVCSSKRKSIDSQGMHADRRRLLGLHADLPL